MFYIILLPLNSGFEIDGKDYREYAEKTAKLYTADQKYKAT